MAPRTFVLIALANLNEYTTKNISWAIRIERGTLCRPAKINGFPKVFKGFAVINRLLLVMIMGVINACVFTGVPSLVMVEVVL